MARYEMEKALINAEPLDPLVHLHGSSCRKEKNPNQQLDLLKFHTKYKRGVQQLLDCAPQSFMDKGN